MQNDGKLFCLFVCLFVLVFRAALAAFGGSQARGLIGTTAASLRHSHTGSKPRLQPIPQLTVTLDP